MIKFMVATTRHSGTQLQDQGQDLGYEQLGYQVRAGNVYNMYVATLVSSACGSDVISCIKCIRSIG